MASIDLRTEAKQIVDGLSDETLSIAVGLLTALKAQKPIGTSRPANGLSMGTSSHRLGARRIFR